MMDERGIISWMIDTDDFDRYTWSGPSGTLKLIFADGHEELCPVSGSGKREYTVQQGGTLDAVYFASDDDPAFWYSIGGIQDVLPSDEPNT